MVLCHTISVTLYYGYECARLRRDTSAQLAGFDCFDRIIVLIMIFF